MLVLTVNSSLLSKFTFKILCSALTSQRTWLTNTFWPERNSLSASISHIACRFCSPTATNSSFGIKSKYLRYKWVSALLMSLCTANESVTNDHRFMHAILTICMCGHLLSSGFMGFSLAEITLYPGCRLVMLYHLFCVCLCIYMYCQDVYVFDCVYCTHVLPHQNACKHRAASGWGGGLHAERGIANILWDIVTPSPPPSSLSLSSICTEDIRLSVSVHLSLSFWATLP